jgi:hypothetical protein
MKLSGEFVLREIVGDIVVIPVGKTALKFQGMIVLNEVSEVIWKCLEQETTFDEILKHVTEEFEVDSETAGTDISEFLEKLREYELLQEI